MAQGGLTLHFAIEGDVQLSRRLLLDAEKLKDWAPAFKEAGGKLKSIFSGEVFETEGGAVKEKWQQLSPRYALWKSQRYPGKGILERTGRMRAGFQYSWSATETVVWNDVDYFRYHQSNRPRTKIPRRVMLKLAEGQRTLVVRIFNTYFQKKVNS